MILIFLYALTIPAANWLIGNIGTICLSEGTCLIPVLPGIMAPSGVVMIGAALLLRNLVQIRYGILVSIACIIGGAILSACIAPPTLALASCITFLLSEISDFFVFTGFFKRNFIFAIIISCLVGAIVDSALFLLIAFGNLNHILGLVIGKIYAMLLFVVLQQIKKFIRKDALKLNFKNLNLQ